MSDKTLFLLDGHALVYRAHYAFISRPLFNSKGMNVSAVSGFIRSLWDIIKTYKPSHIGVSFDLSDKETFRHKMYPLYKANRDAQPEDITLAVPIIKEIIEAMNIPVITLRGYEADDIIGTLSKKAEKKGFTVYMVTPDKDYAQLVSENIFMYKPARMGNDIEILGVPEILANWEIERIEQVIDILGLQGDASDNIPGIPGIGPKTAKSLLATYGSMENIILNVEQLKGKQKENIIQFSEQGLLSKTLATIDLNVPVDFDEDTFAFGNMDKNKLSEIFDELEFRSIKKEILEKGEEKLNTISHQGSLFSTEEVAQTIPASKKENIHSIAHQYHALSTIEEIEALAKKLSSYEIICVDTETTGLDPNEAELVGMSFSVAPYEAYYIPFPKKKEDVIHYLQPLKRIFKEKSKTFVGQNIKYDLTILKWYDIEIEGKIFDTMVAHYLTDPDLRHNLNYMSETYLNYEPVDIESLIGKKGKNQKSMRDVPLEDIKEYAAEDADLTLQLYQVLAPKIKEEQLDHLHDEIEAPLVKVLTNIEYQGVNLDTVMLGKYSLALNEKIIDARQKIFDAAGTEFNIDSPKQVGEILFERLKIPYKGVKTKTDQYSTGEEKLSEIADEYPIVQQILDFRGLAKLKSTYVDALPKLINPKDGRLHTQFNQALTATGRLSSSNPNLQNIPIKTEDGREIRKAFIPRDNNHLLLAADYSQIELRLIAELSNDQAMLDAFINGQDIHTATAAKVYNVELASVTPDQRRNAKTVNFSIIYGAGATNLSKNLGISRLDAKDLIDQYFIQFSGLKKYMDDAVKFARDNGFVKTLLGRKRYLRDINSRNGMIRSHAERNAINTPVQGTAADMIKIAMVNIHQSIKDADLQSRMILQVHDELVFDVHKSEVEILSSIVLDKMKNAIPNLKVPIEVGIGIGDNWLEAH